MGVSFARVIRITLSANTSRQSVIQCSGLPPGFQEISAELVPLET
jgi:hypothetical protein